MNPTRAKYSVELNEYQIMRFGNWFCDIDNNDIWILSRAIEQWSLDNQVKFRVSYFKGNQVWFDFETKEMSEMFGRRWVWGANYQLAEPFFDENDFIVDIPFFTEEITLKKWICKHTPTVLWTARKSIEPALQYKFDTVEEAINFKLRWA